MSDGYGEFGGNGSVEWKVDVNDAEWVMDIPKDGKPKGRRQGGVDKYTGSKGTFFKIAIEQPAGPGSIKVSVDDQGKIAIYVPIEHNNPDQIRVSWAYEPTKTITDGATMTVRGKQVDLQSSRNPGASAS